MVKNYSLSRRIYKVSQHFGITTFFFYVMISSKLAESNVMLNVFLVLSSLSVVIIITLLNFS